jgi:hypothetical protein
MRQARREDGPDKRATEVMMLAKSNGGEQQRNSGELIWI